MTKIPFIKLLKLKKLSKKYRITKIYTKNKQIKKLVFLLLFFLKKKNYFISKPIYYPKKKKKR
jgi:hypothetical protein